MSFAGDLEHLSIIDVIQLLHTTRKSGTLHVKGRKGESQLVFTDGYIVSANHFDNSVRIGNILVQANVISSEILEQALAEQKVAGENRKPLIATLIEKEKVKKEQAFRGLQKLIEMTVVEILTWKKGTFSLDVNKIAVSDEYRYFPEKLHEEIILNTQSVLMDALRIFDEQKRDGELVEEEYLEDEELDDEVHELSEGSIISDDDLGLADFDKIERKIPDVFLSLDDRDPAKIHRRKIGEIAPDIPPQDQEALAAFLGKHSLPARHGKEASPHGVPPLSVILFSSDELFAYCVTTLCKHEGILVFSTNDEQYLDHFIGQFLARQDVPLLVFDSPLTSTAGFSEGTITALRQQKKQQYPQISTIQLTSSRDYGFELQSFKDGVRAVIPRPSREIRQEAFVEEATRFLDAFLVYLHRFAAEQGSGLGGKLISSISVLRNLKETPEVAFALLQFVAEIFERSITLIVGKTELIAEKGIGIYGEKSRGAAPVTGLRIPLGAPSLFRTVLEDGGIYWGEADDEAVRQHLFSVIGAPASSTVLLLPLKSWGRVISLTYADFGRSEVAAVPVDLLDIFAGQAGLVLENSVYRKIREKHANNQ